MAEVKRSQSKTIAKSTFTNFNILITCYYYRF